MDFALVARLQGLPPSPVLGDHSRRHGERRDPRVESVLYRWCGNSDGDFRDVLELVDSGTAGE